MGSDTAARASFRVRSACVQLDHLILAVADLDAGAAALTAAIGLAVEPGGVHPDWGTENRIVPLGEAYLELVAVADPEVAAGGPPPGPPAAAAAHAARPPLVGGGGGPRAPPAPPPPPAPP